MSKVIWSGTAQMTMSVLAGHGCIEDTTAQRCGGKDTYAEHTGPSVLNFFCSAFILFSHAFLLHY